MLKSGARQISRINGKSRRGFFNYLAAVSKPKETAASIDAKSKEDGKRFSFDFVEWYRPYEPEFVEGFDALKRAVSDTELKSKTPTQPYAKVNFEEFRDKIKDPRFVDEVEADFQAELDIAQSHTDPYQYFSWSKEAQHEKYLAKNEFRKKYGVPIPPKESEPRTKEELETGVVDTIDYLAEMDQSYDEFVRELRLDYEQAEAERDMFGLKGEMMDFALHPQMAELHEEYAAGKQTFVDKVLYEFEYSRYHKRERLLQLQDETSRQVFLERHKIALRFHGINAAAGGAD